MISYYSKIEISAVEYIEEANISFIFGLLELKLNIQQLFSIIKQLPSYPI